jgi:hypothetical protein
MEIKEFTRTELEAEVQTKLQNMSEADLKWFYCYYHGFDEWPLVITDSTAPAYVPQEEMTYEEVPF